MVNNKMIDVGKEVRYNRIVNPSTGRAVMIPLDHGIILGPLEGITDPSELVADVVSGGADAVIFNAGLCSKLHAEYMGKCGAIFNLTNVITDEHDMTLISSVEYALRNGADAVSVQVLVGSNNERSMLENVSVVSNSCSEWGMPLLAMMYPTQELLDAEGSEADIKAARAGAELGADIVKTSYTGDKESFKKLVDSCPVPVVVASGPKMDSVNQVFDVARDAMECGAIGVAFGRNVWQGLDSCKITSGLVDIVHGGKSLN